MTIKLPHAPGRTYECANIHSQALYASKSNFAKSQHSAISGLRITVQISPVNKSVSLSPFWTPERVAASWLRRSAGGYSYGRRKARHDQGRARAGADGRWAGGRDGTNRDWS